MALTVFGEQTVANFHRAIERWESGYEHSSFCYVAKRIGDGFVIAQAVLWLNSLESKIPFRSFHTENVCAEHFRIADIGEDWLSFIKSLYKSEIIKTPRGERSFPTGDAAWHDAFYTPIHPSALQSQSRVNSLQIKGRNQILEGGPSVLDWELRAADTPYDTVQELMQEYTLGTLVTDRISVEVIASSIMGFDNASAVSGETATIITRLANTLGAEHAAVSYREITPERINRGKILGSQFRWEQTDAAQVGTFELPVAKAAIVHCYAMYHGVAQTHWYITDPQTSQNSRRVIFESFDTGIAILKEFLGRTNTRGQDARDLETGVAWLFWLVGFNALQLGSTGRTQDFADLILMTPNGHVAIVECTTGLLRADNKLPKLLARHATVRGRLDRSNNRYVKLLPIMVSSLSKTELQADLEQAEKLGVGVLTREDLDLLVGRTVVTSNADELFSLAEKNIEQLKNKTTGLAEPELPL